MDRVLWTLCAGQWPSASPQSGGFSTVTLTEHSFIDNFIQNVVNCVSDLMIDNKRCLSAAARAAKVGMRSNHEVSLIM